MAAVPEPTIAAGHVFCFGLGYTALRLARRLKAAGWRVSGTVRDPQKADALAAAEGTTVHVFDGTAPMAEPGFDGVTHVIDSIPPAAPSVCPVIDLVELMASRYAWSPKSRLTAATSAASPNGVEVPWALM